jgi:hypothetical protein
MQEILFVVLQIKQLCKKVHFYNSTRDSFGMKKKVLGIVNNSMFSESFDEV